MAIGSSGRGSHDPSVAAILMCIIRRVDLAVHVPSTHPQPPSAEVPGRAEMCTTADLSGNFKLSHSRQPCPGRCGLTLRGRGTREPVCEHRACLPRRLAAPSGLVRPRPASRHNRRRRRRWWLTSRPTRGRSGPRPWTTPRCHRLVHREAAAPRADHRRTGAAAPGPRPLAATSSRVPVQPLDAGGLRAIVADLGPSRADRRDRALILLAYAAALRSSEVAALDLDECRPRRRLSGARSVTATRDRRPRHSDASRRARRDPGMLVPEA